MALILALDMAGVPSRWVVVEDAITYYARHMVAWSLGDVVATYHGGRSRLTGTRSELSTRSIIAIKGAVDFTKGALHPHLSNAALFSRDRHVCAYCGERYRERELSRDHVIPAHAGGMRHTVFPGESVYRLNRISEQLSKSLSACRVRSRGWREY